MDHRSRGCLYWFLTISVIAVLLGLAALRIHIISSPPEAPSEAVAVYGVKVKSDTVVAGPDYIATVEPQVRTSISSRVQARIEKIFVDEGDRVEKDTLLAQLDDRELQKGNQVAQAKEQAVRKELSSLKTQAQAARADKNYAKN